MADAHLAEAKRFDGGFGRFDLAQRLHGHLGAVWDTRGEAGKRWLVPVRQSEAARSGADLRLAHAPLEQGKSDAAANRRSVSRPVVAGIVGSRAVRDVLQAQLTLNRLQGF